MMRTVALVVLANVAGVSAVPRQLQDGTPEKCETDEVSRCQYDELIRAAEA